MRPRRTVVFATWDAEEWGLIGSTEYVEDDSLRLMRGGVAYLNQDGSAQGAIFGGGGSPSLRSTLRDITRLIPDPNGKGSVYPNGSRARDWRSIRSSRRWETPAAAQTSPASTITLESPTATGDSADQAGCITRCTTRITG